MHFSRLDAFFHVASQGSNEAYQLLYNEFLYRARIKINQTTSESLKFTGFSEDFLQFIDELFISILNDYDGTKGSFTYFADYVLNLRIPPKVAAAALKRSITYQVKNDEGKDMDIEDFADPNQNTMVYDVAIEDFKHRISSPSRNTSNETRLKNKIAMMRYAGYKKTEICKILKISDGTLRRYLKLMNKSGQSDDFNFDLK